MDCKDSCVVKECIGKRVSLGCISVSEGFYLFKGFKNRNTFFYIDKTLVNGKFTLEKCCDISSSFRMLPEVRRH